MPVSASVRIGILFTFYLLPMYETPLQSASTRLILVAGFPWCLCSLWVYSVHLKELRHSSKYFAEIDFRVIGRSEEPPRLLSPATPGFGKCIR